MGFLEAMRSFSRSASVCAVREFVITYVTGACLERCCHRQKIVNGLSPQDARLAFESELPLAHVVRISAK